MLSKTKRNASCNQLRRALSSGGMRGIFCDAGSGISGGALPPFGSVSGSGKLSAPHSAWHLGCWPTPPGNVLHNGTPACWASSRRCSSRGRPSSSSAVDKVLHLPGLSRGDTGSIFSGSVDLSSHMAWAIMAGAFAYKGEAGQAGREAPGRSPPLMASASC
jgi:hypothetical protein